MVLFQDNLFKMDKKISYKDLNTHLKIVVAFVTVEVVLTTLVFAGITYSVISGLI